MYRQGAKLTGLASLASASVLLSTSEPTTTNNKPKLTYFPAYGKGETIKLCLAAGKVDYEMRNVTLDEWATLKPTMKFGQIPVFNWDDLELYQSNTIVRFIAKKTGLAGAKEEDFFLADMVLEHTVDFLKELLKVRFCSEPEAKQKAAEKFMNSFLPGWLAGTELLLKERGGIWFAADQLTFADLAVQHVLFFLTWKDDRAFKDVTGCDGRFTILDKYPLTKANYEMVGRLPEVKKYLDSRPDSPSGL